MSNLNLYGAIREWYLSLLFSDAILIKCVLLQAIMIMGIAQMNNICSSWWCTLHCNVNFIHGISYWAWKYRIDAREISIYWINWINWMSNRRRYDCVVIDAERLKSFVGDNCQWVFISIYWIKWMSNVWICVVIDPQHLKWFCVYNCQWIFYFRF